MGLRRLLISVGILLLLVGSASAAITGEFAGSRVYDVRARQGTGWFTEASPGEPDVLQGFDMTIPDGEEALVRATFSAESRCVKNPGPGEDPVAGECLVRLAVAEKVGPDWFEPIALYPPDFYTFDHTRTGQRFEGQSFQGVVGPLGPGTYRVSLEVAVTSSQTFYAGDNNFTVELIRA